MLRAIASLAILLAAAPALAATPAAKPASAQSAYDARDPASLIALLSTMGAKAEVVQRSDTDVKLSVTTPAYSFGVQFVDCNITGKGCQGLAFTTSSNERHANLAQLNGFNQTSITCRVFQDQMAKPHVVYATILSARDSQAEMRTHIGVWQGCLASFGAFLTDPNGFLAAAP